MKKGLVLLGISTLILTGCGKVTDIECSEVVTIDGEKYNHKISATVVEKKTDKVTIIYEPVDSGKESGTEYKDKVDDLKLKYGSKLPSNVSSEKTSLIELKDVERLENGTSVLGLAPNKFIKEVKFENPKISCKTKNNKQDENVENK